MFWWANFAPGQTCALTVDAAGGNGFRPSARQVKYYVVATLGNAAAFTHTAGIRKNGVRPSSAPADKKTTQHECRTADHVENHAAENEQGLRH